MDAILLNKAGILSMGTSRRPSSTTLFGGVQSSLVASKGCHSTVTTMKLAVTNPNTTIRRSGNYKPTTWDFQYIQSINNHYAEDKYMERFDEVKEEMKKYLLMMMIHEKSQELDKLELIDNLERLGVSYHFKDEIMQILRGINDQTNIADTSADSFYYTALKFRILRQHGFHISQGTHLKNYVDSGSYGNHEENTIMMELVVHALELPRHWMMQRLEAEWYIHIYERMSNANPLLLEFAKLDFNIVQATLQQDLKILSRWWKKTALTEKLSFSRDILVENMVWAVGALFEPQHSYFRRMITKVIVFISIIDDIYDVYGTLDELELFTNAIQRWDLKAMEELPDYMKVCYLALFNTINEVAYEVLKDQGVNVLPYLIKSWTDLCKSYLQEARWYHNGYKPSLEEYMDNAWISIAIPMVLVHAFFLITDPITKEALESLTNYPDIIRSSATIFRLIDDLGTSSGDKYMKWFDELKKEIKEKIMIMLEGSIQELDVKLELIDNLERLGVSYHFKDEIMQILRGINDQRNIAATSADSLYYTALKFRILRQYGFHISQGHIYTISL